MPDDYKISTYDRTYGNLIDVSLHTRPSTIKTTVPITGESETFIIQTLRHEDTGDYVFLEYIDGSGRATRIVLPPKVTSVIGSQHDSLTTRRRSITSKRVMADRKAAGEVFGFQKGHTTRRKRVNKK